VVKARMTSTTTTTVPTETLASLPTINTHGILRVEHHASNGFRAAWPASVACQDR
jgi:hypothetical protein